MPQLLPRFAGYLAKMEDERKIARIILEAEAADEAPRLVKGADGHNWQRMRGVPLISKGVRGTMPGTDPLAALIATENRRRR